MKIHNPIAFIIYQSPSWDCGWRITCVPLHRKKYRTLLHRDWRGLSGAELSGKESIVSTTKSGLFVHASGHIGAHPTFEGIMKMATYSQQPKPNTNMFRANRIKSKHYPYRY